MNEETLFNLALEKPPHERSAFLASACGGDEELRRRVERLLKSHDDPGSFLQEPIVPSTGGSPSEATQALEPGAPVPTNPGKTQPEQSQTLHDDLTFLAASSRADAIGRMEHYHVLQVIGKGGFGTVLKAFDEKLHRVVAIKVLSPELAASGTARQRFIREARTAAAVTHEHVVTIHAVVEEHRPPYLVMQLIDGQTLQEKLDKVGMLSLREILRIGMQMAEGLAAAHKQGLVHRDIKPANILLENGVERVKITDFGLARAVDDASVTQSGTVAGTPMYMSPEQAEGLPLDHRSDLFSLGTVLYVMCTGRPPFRATGTMAVLKRVIDDTPRPIREVNPEIPEWLCDIIGKLHAKKPEDRYQTAKEVAELLGQRLADVQAGRAIERAEQRASSASEKTEPQSVAVKAEVPQRGHRWALINALLVFTLLVAVAWWYAPTLSRYARNVGKVVLEASAEEVQHLVLTKDGEIVTLTVSEEGIELPPGYHDLEAVAIPGRVISKIEQMRRPHFNFTRAFSFPGARSRLTLVRGEEVRIRVTTETAPLPPTEKKPPTPEPGWVQLFNGKDLTGWNRGKEPTGEWKVEKGHLVGKGAKAFLVSDRKDFGDFHLRMEAKYTGIAQVVLRGKGNSASAEGYWLHLANNNGVMNTGAVRTAVTKVGHNGDVREDHTKPNEWFTIEVIGRGKDFQTFVNGKKVLDWVDPDPSHAIQGHLQFYLPRPDSEVHVKKIEIKELPSEEPVWVKLFNGKDLTGWKTHPDQPGDWQVKDGELVGQGKTSHLFSERQDFADFHLRFEAKLKTGASGVFFRTGFSLPVFPKAGGRVPAGFEAAFQPDKNAILPGVLKYQGASVSFGPIRIQRDTWFTEEIIARGNHITVKVNGVTTAEYTDRERSFRKGAFALQMWGPQTEVRFRNIEIKELPPEEPGWVQLFNGENLNGWHAPAYKESWSVARGVLKGAAKDAKHVRLYSDRTDLQNFHLRMRAQVSPEGTARVYFRHDDQAAKMPAAWFEHNKAGELTVRVALAGSTTPRKDPLAVKLVKLGPDHAFNVEFIAAGSRFEIKVEGESVHVHTFGADAQPKERVGIVLQMWDPSTVFSLSKIEIKELPPEPGWVQLFNGKDTTGWKYHPKHPGEWTVKDGILTSGGKENYLYTERGDYANFHLRAEAQVESGYSAINFRTPFGSAKDNEFSLPFLDGYQVVVGQAGANPTGSVRRNGAKFWLADKGLVDPKDWFQLEIITRGDRMESLINGKPAALFIDPQRLFEKGHIALQMLRPDTVVRFRKIEIKELPPGAAAPPFVLLARDKQAESRHATLADAVKAAQSGDTIEIRGDGPFETAPIDLGKKALAIRAGDGYRPHLKHQPTDPNSTAPVLHTQGPLVLEGLTLERTANPGAKGWSPNTAVVSVHGAPVRIANCRLIAHHLFTRLQLVGVPNGIVTNCEVLGDAGTHSGIAYWPPAASRLHLENNLVISKSVGLGTSFGSKEEFAKLENAAISLRRNTIQASFAISYHNNIPLTPAPPVDPKRSRLQMEASGNIFTGGNAFGFPVFDDAIALKDAVPLLPRLASFQDEDNLYEAGANAFLQLSRAGKDPFQAIKNLQEWHKLWGIAKSRSQVGTPVFQGGGDLVAKSLRAPETVSTADFRLAKDSPGKGAGPGGKDLGADVDVVGPGEAYEKWKKTKEYEEWRKQTDALMGTGIGWVPLFNGKDFTGWEKPDAKVWTIENGQLVCRKGAGTRPLFTESAKFSDFHLRIEIESIHETALSVGFRAAPGLKDIAPKGYEVSIGTAALPGTIIKPGTKNPLVAQGLPNEKPNYPVTHVWEVIARGSKFVVRRDGVVVNEGEDSTYKTGQLHLIPRFGNFGNTEARIRKIEIKDLPPEPGWVPLFNGKDTTGWKYHDKHPGEWTVKDGILTSGGKGGNYLYSVRDDYANFHLRAEVKLEKGFSTAIFFRTGFGSTWEDSKMQPGLDGHYALISRPFDDNPTGSLRVTGLPYSVAENGIVDAKDWFVLEIIAKGNRIESLVNGKPAAMLVDKRKKSRFEKGHIALQMLNPDIVVHYRKIEIMELPANP